MQPQRTAYSDPVEPSYVEFYNPLTETQTVIEHTGPLVTGPEKSRPAPTGYACAPGKTMRVPKRVEGLAHVVQNNAIIGGQAPQLVLLVDGKPATDRKLDEAFITDHYSPEGHPEAMKALVNERLAVLAKRKGLDAKEASGPRRARGTQTVIEG